MAEQQLLETIRNVPGYLTLASISGSIHLKRQCQLPLRSELNNRVSSNIRLQYTRKHRSWHKEPHHVSMKRFRTNRSPSASIRKQVTHTPTLPASSSPHQSSIYRYQAIPIQQDKFSRKMKGHKPTKYQTPASVSLTMHQTRAHRPHSHNAPCPVRSDPPSW